MKTRVHLSTIVIFVAILCVFWCGIAFFDVDTYGMQYSASAETMPVSYTSQQDVFFLTYKNAVVGQPLHFFIGIPDGYFTVDDIAHTHGSSTPPEMDFAVTANGLTLYGEFVTEIEENLFLETRIEDYIYDDIDYEYLYHFVLPAENVTGTDLLIVVPELYPCYHSISVQQPENGDVIISAPTRFNTAEGFTYTFRVMNDDIDLDSMLVAACGQDFRLLDYTLVDGLYTVVVPADKCPLSDIYISCGYEYNKYPVTCNSAEGVTLTPLTSVFGYVRGRQSFDFMATVGRSYTDSIPTVYHNQVTMPFRVAVGFKIEYRENTSFMNITITLPAGDTAQLQYADSDCVTTHTTEGGYEQYTYSRALNTYSETEFSLIVNDAPIQWSDLFSFMMNEDTRYLYTIPSEDMTTRGNALTVDAVPLNSHSLTMTDSVGVHFVSDYAVYHEMTAIDVRAVIAEGYRRSAPSLYVNGSLVRNATYSDQTHSYIIHIEYYRTDIVVTASDMETDAYAVTLAFGAGVDGEILLPPDEEGNYFTRYKTPFDIRLRYLDKYVHNPFVISANGTQLSLTPISVNGDTCIYTIPADTVVDDIALSVADLPESLYKITKQECDGSTIIVSAEGLKDGQAFAFSVLCDKGFSDSYESFVTSLDGAALTPTATAEYDGGVRYEYSVEAGVISSDIVLSTEGLLRNTYTMTVQCGRGVQTTDTTFSVTHGIDVSFDITTAAEYSHHEPIVHIGSNRIMTITKNSDTSYTVTVGGELCTGDTTVTIGDLDRNVYNIVCIEGTGTDIDSPTTIEYGGTLTFSLTVSSGYNHSLPIVTVGGIEVRETAVNGRVYTYTLTDITTDMLIESADLPVNTYMVTTVGGHGTENTIPSVISFGSELSFTVNVLDAYTQSTPTVTIFDQTLIPDSAGVYHYGTFYVYRDLTVNISDLSINTYTVRFPTGRGYTNTLANGSAVVEHGDSLHLGFSLNEGYVSKDFALLLNGETLLPTAGGYILENITTDCSLVISGIIAQTADCFADTMLALPNVADGIVAVNNVEADIAAQKYYYDCLTADERAALDVDITTKLADLLDMLSNNYSFNLSSVGARVDNALLMITMPELSESLVRGYSLNLSVSRIVSADEISNHLSEHRMSELDTISYSILRTVRRYSGTTDSPITALDLQGELVYYLPLTTDIAEDRLYILYFDGEIVTELRPTVVVENGVKYAVFSAPTIGSFTLAAKDNSYWWAWLAAGVLIVAVVLKLLSKYREASATKHSSASTARVGLEAILLANAEHQPDTDSTVAHVRTPADDEFDIIDTLTEDSVADNEQTIVADSETDISAETYSTTDPSAVTTDSEVAQSDTDS